MAFVNPFTRVAKNDANASRIARNKKNPLSEVPLMAVPNTTAQVYQQEIRKLLNQKTNLTTEE